jgi:hypothetical protein
MRSEAARRIVEVSMDAEGVVEAAATGAQADTLR